MINKEINDIKDITPSLKTYLWESGNFLLQVGAIFKPELAIAIAGINTFKGIYLKEEIESFSEKDKLKFVKLFNENENFQHLLLQVSDACNRSKEVEKAKMFCKLISGAVDSKNYSKDSDIYEEMIYLFSDLSWRQIKLLTIVYKVTNLNISNIINIPLHTDEYFEASKKHMNKLLEELKGFDEDFIYSTLEMLCGKGLLSANKVVELAYFTTSYFEKIYKSCSKLEEYLIKESKKYTI